jgi:hypothetical protein
MSTAIKSHDKCRALGEECMAETSINVALSSAINLVRDFDKTIRAALEAQRVEAARQIWKRGEPPKDGKTYYVRLLSPVRWKPYSPKSQQYKSGVKGQWQEMNEYGGRVNCAAPFVDWTSREEYDQNKAPQAAQEDEG